MTELISASGPDRYFGGTIETFALPMGAFIVIALLLFYMYRRPHNVPRLKYLRPAHQTAFGTREPGSTGVITLRPPVPASAPAVEADTAVPGGQQPHASETLHQPVADRTEPADRTEHVGHEAGHDTEGDA